MLTLRNSHTVVHYIALEDHCISYQKAELHSPPRILRYRHFLAAILQAITSLNLGEKKMLQNSKYRTPPKKNIGLGNQGKVNNLRHPEIGGLKRRKQTEMRLLVVGVVETASDGGEKHGRRESIQFSRGERRHLVPRISGSQWDPETPRWLYQFN